MVTNVRISVSKMNYIIIVVLCIMDLTMPIDLKSIKNPGDQTRHYLKKD